jgi:putative addiction module component (TIGR02574 family)
MAEFDAVRSAAFQLSTPDRLRLIDELSSTVPDDQPPTPSTEWLSEIERRSSEIDNGSVTLEAWESIRARLFRKTGIDRAG